MKKGFKVLNRGDVLRLSPFQGYQDRVGRVEVKDYAMDENNKELRFVRILCTSCHQVFMLYGFMFDNWVKNGLPFDEFILVKKRARGGRIEYYAEIYFAADEDSRLRVSVVINNKTTNGYDRN